MSKLYLITGFLGAGKTTFLKNFITLFAGKRIQLIVNEFGKEGVDGVLLSELGAFLEEISGGSVFCSCRLDRFESVLRNSADLNADIILVEASGLSDPTGVRKLFSQTERFPHIDYQGAIVLVDAVRFAKVYATARSCVKQLAVGDIAVVNKIDTATDEQLEETVRIIKSQRPEMVILQTSYGRVDGSILEQLTEASRYKDDDDMILTADLTLRKLLIRVSPTISAYDLQKFIDMFSEVTFRVKGFVQTTDGIYLADCVGNVTTLSPYEGEVPEEKQGYLVALSGSGMPLLSRVKEAAAWYPNEIISIE